MTRRGRLMLVGVVVGLMAFASGAMLSWPRSDAGLRVVNNRLVGEATGFVTAVGPDDHTVRVSASIFGLRPITVHVDRDTTIVVGDKAGGLGDLLPGTPVHVGYEMERNRRVAKIIELGVAVRTSRSTPPPATEPLASIPVDDLPGAETTPAPDASAATPSAVTPPAASDEVETAAAVSAGEPAEMAPVSPSVVKPAPVLPRPVRPSSAGARVNARSALPPRESVLDLSASVHDWVEAAMRRDVSAQVALYAERINLFYGRHDVSREAVRAEKLRAFGSGATLLDTGSPQIRLEPGGRVAIVRFSKRFVEDGDGHARRGEGMQELRWERTNRGWRIVGEDDAPALSR